MQDRQTRLLTEERGWVIKKAMHEQVALLIHFTDSFIEHLALALWPDKLSASVVT